jgi:hypothetical protein
VILSHNTTTSRTTQFSPFKLLYGEEAMLPEELCLGTWRDIPSSDEDPQGFDPEHRGGALAGSDKPVILPGRNQKVEKQKDSTEVHTVGRPGTTQNTEGKAEG